MGDLNIFETIGQTTGSIEPFHSRFLADALNASLTGDRSLFEAVWKLTAPSDWHVPDNPEVEPEKKVDVSGRRIDICMVDRLQCRVVGIEVKTVDASAKPDQLETYRRDLEQKYDGYKVAIAYLTPFNRGTAGGAAAQLKAVNIFEKFADQFENARHVSWLQVAEIPWDTNGLWKQHQDYVRTHISPPRYIETIKFGNRRNRSFDEFFGPVAAEGFWKAMADMGVDADGNGATINLAGFEGDARSLARAFEVLIEDGEGVSSQAEKQDEFREDLRRPFVVSEARKFHEALFDLSRRYPYVWLEGKGDYGLKVAHKPQDVSLVTSRGSERIVTGQRR